MLKQLINKLLSWLLQTPYNTIDFVTDDSRRYYTKLFIAVPLTIWSSVFYQTSPLFIKWQVDALTENWQSVFGVSLGSVLNVFLVIVVLSFFLNILDSFFIFLKNSFLSKINFQTEAYLENKFLKFLTRFDESFLGSENNKRMIRGYSWRLKDAEKQTNSIMIEAFELISAFAALFFILPIIHPYLLGLILLSMIGDYIIGYIQNQNWRNHELIETRQSDQVFDLNFRILQYFEQVLNNNWFAQITSLYQKRRSDWFDTKYKQEQTNRQFDLVKQFLENLLNLATLIVAAFLVINNQIEIGTFVVFGYYISRFKDTIIKLSDFVRKIWELRFEMFRFNFLLSIQPKIDYSNIVDSQIEQIDSLNIKNLNFTYPSFYEEERQYLETMKTKLGLNKITKKNSLWAKINQKLTSQSISGWQRSNYVEEIANLEKYFLQTGVNKIILQNINLELKKGNIYSIVGYNGAGKSTLTKLLKRSLDPTNGDILIKTKIGQINLKTIDPLLWKAYLACLEQESMVWETISVRDNLLLGLNNRTADDAEIFAALKLVGLEQITDLDKIIGEGLELSGGQKQLLELARVYIQKPPIIILDEGTNQLDAVKEQNILSILNTLKKDSIIIFITHRMTTCSRTDEVIVLENGEITAQGKPQELLKPHQNNLFKQFWDIQLDRTSTQKSVFD